MESFLADTAHFDEVGFKPLTPLEAIVSQLDEVTLAMCFAEFLSFRVNPAIAKTPESLKVLHDNGLSCELEDLFGAVSFRFAVNLFVDISGAEKCYVCGENPAIAGACGPCERYLNE